MHTPGNFQAIHCLQWLYATNCLMYVLTCPCPSGELHPWGSNFRELAIFVSFECIIFFEHSSFFSGLVIEHAVSRWNFRGLVESRNPRKYQPLKTTHYTVCTVLYCSSVKYNWSLLFLSKFVFPCPIATPIQYCMCAYAGSAVRGFCPHKGQTRRGW